MKSLFGNAVSSHYLSATCASLQDAVTARPEISVPMAESVWLELPYREVPNRNIFYPAVTAFVKQCRYYNVPFIMFHAPRSSPE